MKLGVDEDGGVGQSLLFRRLDADPEHHVVPGSDGHRPNHAGKVCSLQDLSLVALLNAHELDQRAGQVRSPAVELDGDGVLVQDGEEVVSLLGHPERAEVDDVLTR